MASSILLTGGTGSFGRAFLKKFFLSKTTIRGLLFTRGRIKAVGVTAALST